MKDKWKVTAIVFMSLFVIQTLFVIWVYNIGAEALELEDECSIEICKDYDSYYYDSYEEDCYCFTDGEIEFAQSMS